MRNQVRKNKPEAGYPMLALSGFLFLFLPFYHNGAAMDEVMQPRLLATGIASLALWIVGLFVVKKSGHAEVRMNTSLTNTLILNYFLIITSIFFALNYQQGFHDLSKAGIAIALFLLIVNNLTSPDRDIRRIVVLSSISAAVSLAIGFSQYFNGVVMATTDKLPDGLELVYAVKGLMFHKNEYSTHLMLLLPFVLAGNFFLANKWRPVVNLLGFLIIIMLILLKTRAVWMGILGGGFVAAVIVVVFSKSVGSSKWVRNLTLTAILLVGAGFFSVQQMSRVSDEQSLIGRLQSVTNLESKDNIHRLNIWSSTVNMIKDNPLTGVGAGNWTIRIPDYYQTKFNRFEELNWTRPHNDFLWVAAEKGIPGLAVYLLLFGLIIYSLMATIRRSQNLSHKRLAVVFTATITSYLITAFFSFPMERTEHLVYLLLIAGIATVVNPYSTSSPRWFRVPGMVLPGLLSAMTLIIGVASLNHESHIRKAIEAQNERKWEKVLDESIQAKNQLTSLDPYALPAEYYSGLASFKMKKFGESIAYLNTALRFTPNNIWINNQLGQAYYQVEDYKNARKHVDKVLAILPHDKNALKSLASIYFYEKKYNLAIVTLRKIKGWHTDQSILNNIDFLKKEIAKRKAAREIENQTH